MERPLRTLASVFAATLGIAAAVATITLSTTASHQVSSRFDALRATQVAVHASPDRAALAITSGDPPFPADADQRLDGLNGVVASGVLYPFGDTAEVRTNHLVDGSGSNSTVSAVMGATVGLRAAVEVPVTGTWFNEWQRGRALRVALVGHLVAHRLSLSTPGRTIYIDNLPYTLLGVLGATNRAPELENSVVIPDTTAFRLFPHLSGDARAVVRTAPGAAQVVASQAPLRLAPEQPTGFAADAPPDPRRLRKEVESDTTTMLLLIALVTVAIGALAIGNATMSSVHRRLSEIGIRRALGATPRHVLAHTLAEAGALGTLAGLIGSVVGITVTFGAAFHAGWVPVIDARVALLATPVGMLLGAAAGIWPSLAAARIEPTEALRSSG